MAGLFVVAAVSQAKLQTVEKSNTIALAEDTRRFSRSREDVALRGSILSADGKPLAQDQQTTELTINFAKGVPRSDAFFLDVSRASGIPASEFEAVADSLRDRKRAIKTWLTPLSPDQSKAVNAVRQQWRADGVSVARSGRRAYPMADATACFVGYVRKYAQLDPKNPDSAGTVRTGLEATKDELLTGENGFRKGLTDRTGAFLPTRMAESGKKRQDGKDVVLTIDSDLQSLAYEAVKSGVEANKATNGVALVMDPKTGDLLAMANYPSFDPNEGAEVGGAGATGYNPSYMAVLEPGSTFKILTLAKALDARQASMRENVHCTGVLPIGKRSRIRCDAHHGKRAHGTISVETAIAKSCNVAAASWARRVGREDFIGFVRELGLLKRTELGVPGENRGRFNEDEPAKDLQLATVGFGQSISCTPVGLTSAFALLANGGVRMEPRLIKSIGGIEEPVREAGQLIGPEAAQQVLACMEAVVESDEGTGKGLRIPGYRLGGKTGTAQKIGKGQRGYVSNFVGYVPAHDPKAVVLVMINDPKGGAYYGASVAGPVFVQVAKAVIRHFDLKPTEPILPEKKAGQALH
jgi:cell division protein FtsI/penicillin-binding protein 2